MRSRGRRVFGDVYTAIQNAQKPDTKKGRDVILWRHNEEDYKDHFSTVRTWDQIRDRGAEVSWHISFGLHKEYHAMLLLFG